MEVDAGDASALCVMPYELSGNYQLDFEFTRMRGEDVVGVILPLGKGQVFFELSGWSGAAHGLSRINKSSTRSDENPTSVRPGELENGRRYRVSVSVQRKQGGVSITGSLDGASLFDWSGGFDDIEPNIAFSIPNRLRPALASSRSKVVFHSLSVLHDSGDGKPIELDLTRFRMSGAPTNVVVNSNATMKRVPATGGPVDLTDVIWQDTRGQLEIVSFKGEQIVRLQGQDDTVALLPGSQLADGEIEVEIAADIFSGIAFRAADVENYELIYFRPQNSGTAKHENTVQYVSKGIPDAGWRSLRERFPGKYEAGADMEMNEWFRAKLVIRGKTVAVYVDNAEQPALVVDDLMSDRKTGAIGLWGWRSHFRNFSFTPAQ